MAPTQKVITNLLALPTAFVKQFIFFLKGYCWLSH